MHLVIQKLHQNCKGMIRITLKKNISGEKKKSRIRKIKLLHFTIFRPSSSILYQLCTLAGRLITCDNDF